METGGTVPLLFAQVCFHIIQSERLSPERATKLAKVLSENGAIQHSDPSIHGRLPFNNLTHIISASVDFEGYEAAEDALMPIVTPGWIDASVLKKRLANPKSYSPDPRLFFSGLVVCIADLPAGDKDAIIGGVLAMGGLYSGTVSKLVTHIVALNMEPKACEVVVTKGLNCKLVLPHWFDDCLRLGRRIDEGPYILPNPEIMRLRPGDHIPSIARPDLRSIAADQAETVLIPSGSPSQQRRDLHVFRDRAIMLSEDLGINKHLRETIEDLIKGGGGHITSHSNDADILVCQYRDGDNYQTASRQGKVVGNLPWLFHLVIHNAWTSPFRRLLHYPIARNGLPGFKIFRISLSNYNGEARIYLESLAKVAGCEFTKTMKMDNTHLITAHVISEKCDAAKEWNINMVNHLWLEESYAKWQIQSLTNPRYTTFPPRTNLSEIVGQTPIDKQALERHFFPKSVNIRPGLSMNIPLVPLQPPEYSISSATNALQFPKSSIEQGFSHRPRQPDDSNLEGNDQDHPPGEASVLKTPASFRTVPFGKENSTPPTTGSRSAKARAVAKLHDLATDIALYEKEKKRVGGVIFGGRRSIDKNNPDATRKRSFSGDEESYEGLVQEESKVVKRAKTAKAPLSMRLLVTGYAKWSEDAKRYNEARAQLRALGILITQDHSSCSHLAAPKILRTQKFICAMAKAPIVVSTRFVEECIAENEALDPEQYLLEDPEGEKRYHLSLPEAVKRARANRGHLLWGLTVYCTDHVHGGFETYKSIVEVNGGRCLLFRARPGSITSTKTGFVGDEVEVAHCEEPKYVYLISGTTLQDEKLWTKFREMVQNVGKHPRIVKTDWMLDLALSQEKRWDTMYEMTNNDIKTDD